MKQITQEWINSAQDDLKIIDKIIDQINSELED